MTKSPSQPRAKTKRAPLPTFELEILWFNEDGLGIGRHQSKEVLLAGVLPGEKVLASIEHEGRHRIVGRLVKVVEKSPDRAFSPCKVSRNCQGCSLICMSYRAQLEYKNTKVREALQAYPSLAQVQQQTVWGAEKPMGYRSNAKLVMTRERGQVKIGLYRRGSHDVVDIGDCPLHHPLINRVVAVVREEIEKLGIFVFSPKTRRGLLRYLLVKVSPDNNKAMVTFVTTERDFRQITHLGKWLMKKVPEVISVQQNVNASEGNVVIGRDTLKMLGTPDLIDQVGDIRLRIAPASFFQVNNAQAARIYALVRQWAGLSKEETAVDIYCGIGGIALNLAQDAGQVIGIEMVEDAVINARENARLNKRDNCTFIAGDAAELVADLAAEITSGSVIVLNPPRGGCERSVLEAASGLQPRQIIYVSCNPQTLARDLDILSGLGYKAEEVQPVDMFPQTPHIESVTRLIPCKGK